jgi:methyl-accepting chemotaxis protein
MKNMKISMKLILSFLIIIVLAAVVGAVGIVGMYALHKADDEMYVYNAKPMGDIAVMYDLFATQRINAANIVIFYNDDREFSMDEEESLKEKEQGFDEAFEDYGNWLSNDEEKAVYEELGGIYYADFAERKQAVRDAVDAGDLKAMSAAIMELDSKGSDVSDCLDALNALNNELARSRVEGNANLFRVMATITVVVLVFAVTVALLLAFRLSGLIAKPIKAVSAFMRKASSTGDLSLDEDEAAKLSDSKDETGELGVSAAAFIGRMAEISEKLERIAGGDLTADIDPLSEKDVMGNAMKRMTDSLNNMFAEINEAATQVSAGSGQIADGAQSLAQGASEQAASVEQLSAAVSEVFVSVKEAADSARNAVAMQSGIKAKAERGSERMNAMTEAVRAINDASQSIGKVIKTIDDIAFQTNILALNAAVEAARAGAAGRGFAVVAEEVRNLAAKSAEAAQDTEALIGNSIDKATLGVKIANETNESFTEIVDGIIASGRISGEIAESADRQYAAIGEINVGIDRVSHVVGQNSATAEESAAASEELSGQAAMLGEFMARFKLREAGRR